MCILTLPSVTQQKQCIQYARDPNNADEWWSACIKNEWWYYYYNLIE